MMHGLHTGPSVSAFAVAERMHLEARVKFGRLPQASRHFQACRDSEIHLLMEVWPKAHGRRIELLAIGKDLL